MGTKKREHRQAVIEGKEPPFGERPKCPVPGCGSFLVDGRSPNGYCPYHEGLLQFLAHALPRIKFERQGTPEAPGLILPGQPGYSVSVEVIKEEMRKHGRVKP